MNLLLCFAGLWLATWGLRYFLSVHPPAPKPRPAQRTINQRRDLASLRNAYVADNISLERFESEVEHVLRHGYRRPSVWATF